MGTLPGLSADLFPYQARGIQWMRETLADTRGLILADEMGLGKTLQVIALLVLDPPPITSPALILCPTSLIANWVREITRFAPGLSVMVHRGALRAGTQRQLQSAHVVVCTYDTLVNDISIFRAFPWTALICDEAQALKNPDSGRRRAVATINRSWTIPMTGTPIENSLLDLWSLADLAVPGILGSRQEFERDFPDSLESARALALITDPMVLQRKVADVAGDLPDRIEIDIPLSKSHWGRSRTYYISSLSRPSPFGNHRTDPQMPSSCRHFGNALQPRKRPPALGPFFASRSTKGLPHRGQTQEAVAGVTARGDAGGGFSAGRRTADGALAGDDAMTTR